MPSSVATPLAAQPNFWKRRSYFAGGRLATGLAVPTSPIQGFFNPTRLLTKLGLVGLVASAAGLVVSKKLQERQDADVTDGLEGLTIFNAGVNAVGLGASVGATIKTIREAFPNPTVQGLTSLALAAGGATSYLFEARQNVRAISSLSSERPPQGDVGLA